MTRKEQEIVTELLREVAAIDWKLDVFPSADAPEDVYLEAIGFDNDEIYQQIVDTCGVDGEPGKKHKKQLQPLAETITKVIRGLITDYLDNPAQAKAPAPEPTPTAPKPASKSKAGAPAKDAAA